MDINNYLPLSSRKANKITAAQARKGSAAPARAGSTSDSGQIKSVQLKEGQLIRGEIIDHRYNEIKIRLEGQNQIISARLSGEAAVSIGQNASFIVSKSAPDRLVLKPLSSGADQTASIIIKALTAAGIATSERNKEIAAELLMHKMPLDKHTLQTLARLAAMHRQASALSLVLMHKNNIPVNSANLKQFQAYLEGTHQLLYKIRDITGSISKILNAAFESAPAGTDPLPAFPGPAANRLNHENNNTGLSKPSGSGISSEQAYAGQLSKGGPTNSILAGAENLQQNQGYQIPSNMLSTALAINGRLIDIYLAAANTANANVSAALQSQTDISSLGNLPAESQHANMQAGTSLSDNPAILADIMDDSDIELLLKQLSDAPNLRGIKDRIADKSATVSEVLGFIKDSQAFLDPGQLLKLLTSQEYAKLLERAFFKKWTLAPEKVSKKQSVKDFYRQLETDMEEINKLLRALEDSDDRAAIQEPLDDMQGKLQFMKDLSNTLAFLQLPVDLKDRQLHADLYVLNRKKGQIDSSQGLTVHLSLETVHLGRLNINLKMTGKRLEAAFFPESTDLAAIIRDNLPLLISSLENKGYITMAEVSDVQRNEQEEAGSLKMLLSQESQDGSIARYSFDIRT